MAGGAQQNERVEDGVVDRVRSGAAGGQTMPADGAAVQGLAFRICKRTSCVGAESASLLC